MMSLIGWLWPPLGFEERKREFLALERAEYAKWYVEEYFPAIERDARWQLAEFSEPLFFRRFCGDA
jgi:hypothetical protein